MSTRSCFCMALLVSAGALGAGPATATMYRCEGNLVTDSPTGGKNCVAMGSRLKSPTFSAEMVDAIVEAEPTGAGPAGAYRDSAAPSAKSTGTRVVVPAPSRKP